MSKLKLNPEYTMPWWLIVLFWLDANLAHPLHCISLDVDYWFTHHICMPLEDLADKHAERK